MLEASIIEPVEDSANVDTLSNPPVQLGSPDTSTLASRVESGQDSMTAHLRVQGSDGVSPLRKTKCPGSQHGKTCRNRIPASSDNRLCESCLKYRSRLETVDTGLVSGDPSILKFPPQSADNMTYKRSRFWLYVNLRLPPSVIITVLPFLNERKI